MVNGNLQLQVQPLQLQPVLFCTPVNMHCIGVTASNFLQVPVVCIIPQNTYNNIYAYN